MAEENAAGPSVVKNCPHCKKILSPAKRYYRNGAYYCNKNCFKKKIAIPAEPNPKG